MCRRRRTVRDGDEQRVIGLNDAAANNTRYSHLGNTVTTSKYTWWNFIPKNLFEQATRVGNVYFFIIAMLQQVPLLSPLGRGTTAMTLAVVVMFTAIKELVEDLRRHRSDAAVNATPVHVVRDGHEVQIEWRHVAVGDICVIQNGEYMPADMFLLASSEPQSMCYVQTAGLDGESNLKIRYALAVTAHATDLVKVSRLRGSLSCAPPNSSLYQFDARLTFDPLKSAITCSAAQMLLRGAQLRNTKWVYGLAVYTGRDTKITKNATKAAIKQSHVERVTNRLIGCIFVFEVLLALISAIGNGLWVDGNGSRHVYLEFSSVNPAPYATISFFTFIILFSNLIPISLYVSMETVKLGQAYFVSQDVRMYLPEKDQPAVCRTSSLMEELGQVQYIFSDKTGTLTRNSMDFKKFTVAGVAYGAGTKDDMTDAMAWADEPVLQMDAEASFDDLSSDDAVEEQGSRSSSSGRSGRSGRNRSGVSRGGDGRRSSRSSRSGSGSGSSSALDEEQGSEDAPPRPTSTAPPMSVVRLFGRDREDQYTLSETYSCTYEYSAEGSLNATATDTAIGVRSATDATAGGGAAAAASADSGNSGSGSRRPGTGSPTTAGIASAAPASTAAGSRLGPPGLGGVRLPPLPGVQLLSTSTVSGAGVTTVGTNASTPPLRPRRPVTETRAAGVPEAFRELSRRHPLRRTPLATGATVPHVCFQDWDGRLTTNLMNRARAKPLRDFFEHLAVCHTVIPETTPDDPATIVYQAASPDEGALVNGARFFGYYFHTKTPSQVHVEANGSNRIYEMLSVNEFTSLRRRMSVVVRAPGGIIKVLVKGADTAIFDLLDMNHAVNQRFRRATDEHLNVFAAEALRTLVMAQRTLTEAELHAYVDAMVEASNIIEPAAKKSALAAAADLVERDLVLVGATAIEDRLQEGVPETIEALRQAGIKFWVLTGDKQETAVMIAYSCQLLTSDMTLICPSPWCPDGDGTNVQDPDDDHELTRMEKLQRLQTSLKGCRARIAEMTEGQELACVLDGETLHLLLGDPSKKFVAAANTKIDPSLSSPQLSMDEAAQEELIARLQGAFLGMARKCKSVIGCRVGPAQKAQVVAFVQSALARGVVTLSIGDGANDVEMIKTAHIGVGITGEEGSAAAAAADYSIAQFRFLKPLLLVHGAWCYERMSKLILYSFYKNIALSLVPFWFVFLSGFSGQTFVEKWTISLYNVVYTALPILIVGIFDQKLSRRSLLLIPKLYSAGQRNAHFGFLRFGCWMASGLAHSLIIFFGCETALRHSIVTTDGLTNDLFSTGLVIMTAMVVTVNAKLVLLETHSWTWMTPAGVMVSFGGYIVWIGLLSYATNAPDVEDSIGVGTYVLRWPLAWFLVLFMPIAALLPDTICKYLKRLRWPDPYQVIQEQAVEASVNSRIAPAVMVRTKKVVVKLWPNNSRKTGFAYDPAPFGHHQLVNHPDYPPTGELFRLPPKERFKATILRTLAPGETAHGHAHGGGGGGGGGGKKSRGAKAGKHVQMSPK